MSIASPYYWLAVLVLASLVGAATRVVTQDRLELRIYRAALAVYVLFWIAIGAATAAPLFWYVNLGPNGWPPLWAGLPLALVVGTLAILVGGHLIALLFGIRSLLLHPRHLRQTWRSGRHPANARRLTADELRAAQAYDTEWQLRDRERNRRLGTGSDPSCLSHVHR
jgi:hypothetical protein